MNDRPGRESTTDSYLNNRESITFELNEEYFKLNEEYLAKLAKVVFTVNAIGSGANVSLASDGSITDTDLNVSLLNVKDNTSVTINYENETITYVTTTGSTVTLSADPEDITHYDSATAHFFAEAEANGGRASQSARRRHRRLMPSPSRTCSFSLARQRSTPSSSISAIPASICHMRLRSTLTPTGSLTTSPGPMARMACW